MNHLGQDPADSILASYTPDMAEHIDTLQDRVKERLAKMKAMNPMIDLSVGKAHGRGGGADNQTRGRLPNVEASEGRHLGRILAGTRHEPKPRLADLHRKALHQPKHRQAIHKGGHLGTIDGAITTDWVGFTHPTERKGEADLQGASLEGA